MKRTVEERVIEVISDVVRMPGDTEVLDVSIKSELAPTSLDQMTIFIALEDEFEQSIPQSEIENIDTVRGIIRYIEKKESSE